MTMIARQDKTDLGAGRTPIALEAPASLRERAAAVAKIAAARADLVDRDGTFPTDGIEAAKRAGFMSLLIAREHGGEGASLTDVAEVCYTLGQACASTAMIVAMHQAALACVSRHCDGSDWHEEFLRRVATDQLLLASSTTEGRGGGNVRSSAAPITEDGDVIHLDRDATVMSYGAQADGIVTTARRAVDAAASDQVLVVFLKEDYTLERSGDWDTLGMRGTSSAGFAFRATGTTAQILPVGYDKIHAQSMVPVSHLTWASLWAGIAAASVTRAQAFTRTAARRAGGQMPPGAAHYTKAAASLRMLRAMIGSSLRTFERIGDDERALGSLDTQAALNLLKVDASELTVATVMSALRACGLAGYRNNGDFGLGRHLRDALSSPIMVHNDRIVGNIATATLMSGVPTSLFD